MGQPSPEEKPEDDVEDSDEDKPIAPTGRDKRDEMVGGRDAG